MSLNARLSEPRPEASRVQVKTTQISIEYSVSLGQMFLGYLVEALEIVVGDPVIRSLHPARGTAIARSSPGSAELHSAMDKLDRTGQPTASRRSRKKSGATRAAA
jgi:hypothetical protein